MPHKIEEIYHLLDSLSPFASQEKWDNSGLNLGSLTGEFEHIVVCLELSREIAQSLQPNTLVIAHHPLFFRPLQNFTNDSYPANLAEILIRKDCKLMALHTNFDKSHLNTYFTHKVLGFESFIPDDSGFVMRGDIEPISVSLLAQDIQARLDAPCVSFAAEDDSWEILSVYVVCGSGCSFLSSLPRHSRACLITGDIKHHDAMMARSMGIALIDVGHYESEKYFVNLFGDILQNAGYNAIIADCKNPFSFCPPTIIP